MNAIMCIAPKHLGHTRGSTSRQRTAGRLRSFVSIAPNFAGKSCRSVRLLEPIPSEKRAKVIVTVLEELDREEVEAKEVDVNLFDDLVGVINVREDGSTAHDKYIAF